MRGITLLGLVGFILTASWPKGSMVPLTMPTSPKPIQDTRPLISVWNPLDNDSGFPQLPAGIHPMENENGTNTTTNSSMVLQDRRNYIIQLNGTREVVDNTDGFQPPPDGEDTQWPKGSMVPLTMLPRGSTIPMENENGTNTTTNSSMVLKDVYIVQLNGTREVVDNTDGFPPPPDGKDTQPTPAKRIQTTRRPISIWNPLDNDSGFKKPTPQALGIWNPLDNDSGFPREPAA